MSKDEKPQPFKIEVLDKIATLLTAAFAFIAAFAWNETMKTLVYENMSGEEAPYIVISYAVLITILAVVVTILIARAVSKAKAVIEHK